MFCMVSRYIANSWKEHLHWIFRYLGGMSSMCQYFSKSNNEVLIYVDFNYDKTWINDVTSVLQDALH